MADQEVAYTPPQEQKTIYEGGALTPPKFTPTYYEWLVSKSEQVKRIGQISSVGTTTTLFTVPDNFTLFITHLWISAVGDSPAGADRGFATFKIGEGDTSIFGCGVDHHGTVATSIGNAFIALTMPIKMNQKEVLKMIKFDLFAGQVLGGFMGFLVSQRDLVVL